jgi:hypothetical protein
MASKNNDNEINANKRLNEILDVAKKHYVIVILMIIRFCRNPINKQKVIFFSPFAVNQTSKTKTALQKLSQM